MSDETKAVSDTQHVCYYCGEPLFQNTPTSPWRHCGDGNELCEVPATPKAVQPGDAPWYLLSTRGDGAFAKIVSHDALHEELHKALCMCGESWDKCKTDGVTEQIKELDDSDSWTMEYPDYLCSHFDLRFEDGSLSIVRITDSEAYAAHLRSADKIAELQQENAELSRLLSLPEHFWLHRYRDEVEPIRVLKLRAEAEVARLTHELEKLRGQQ